MVSHGVQYVFLVPFRNVFILDIPEYHSRCWIPNALVPHPTPVLYNLTSRMKKAQLWLDLLQAC